MGDAHDHLELAIVVFHARRPTNNGFAEATAVVHLVYHVVVEEPPVRGEPFWLDPI
jgi:hypothetical protein